MEADTHPKQNGALRAVTSKSNTSTGGIDILDLFAQMKANE
jgi:hypothetical protein